MPSMMKIKSGKYGTAIRVLLERGGSFQTQHERILIADAEQKKVLEDADLVDANGMIGGTCQGKWPREIVSRCCQKPARRTTASRSP